MGAGCFLLPVDGYPHLTHGWLIKTYYLSLDRGRSLPALIIAFAALQATFQATQLFFIRPLSPRNKTEVRLRLGRWLSLTLEFELAVDTLKTAIAPNWDEIGKLAAIVILGIA